MYYVTSQFCLLCLRFTSEQESPNSEEDPPHVAETVFRDLVCRGSYGNINSILKPVLT